MRSVQIVLCVIAALVSTVYGEQCIKCLGRNREECEVEENTECGIVGCMAISERSISFGVTYPTLEMDCANPVVCGQHLRFNSLRNEDVVDVFVQCCTGELCNNVLQYSIPEDPGELNGKCCPSCLKRNFRGECISTERVPCRGNQNKCFAYEGTVEKADLSVWDYSMKGCISDLGCVLKFNALPGTRELEGRVFECTEPLPSTECAMD